MKYKYIILAILSIIACVLIWELGRHTEIKSDFQQPEGQLVFRMAEHRSEDHPTNEGAHIFAQLVEERTDGKVKILIYDGYALGDEASIIEQIGFGGIDFARVCGVYLDEYADEMSTLCLPGLYDNNEMMMTVFNDETVGTIISEVLKNEKINVLTWYPGSTRGIYYDQYDFRALNSGKLAIPKSQMKITEMEAMGFQPIPTIQDNINSYLNGDYVEGAEGELLDYYYNKSYNQSKYFTQTESRIPEAFVVSNTALKQLTVEQQQIVMQAAYDAGIITARLIQEKEEEILNILELLGCHFDNVRKTQTYKSALEEMEKIAGNEALLEQIKNILDE